jgi:hypothetical protein
MDFESGRATYPAVMHSVYGTRDVPFAPVNLVFRNFLKTIGFSPFCLI